ncbi:outer membrane protein assembly factor BamD [Ampullimonas aquatilis]|uniref:outer membrane protein assembly factor BamD n=1 Tax=Ampullimonas aquatilis TaxID=1341549 RepID=UPI003C7415A4
MLNRVRRLHQLFSRSQLTGALVLGLAISLSGCGTTEEKDDTVGWSVEKLYADGHEELTDGNYQRAIKVFERLEARFPFGPYATQAQMETAYAHYKFNEPAQALAAADRFIKLHPNHPRVDYMYYLKGLVNFNDNLGFLSSFSGQDMSERDDKATREAFDTFKTLVTRFPDSPYAEDATQRMRYLVNSMASHEVHVARYYVKKKAYVAAINRAQQAVKDYPEAPAIEEALALLAQSYEAMGMQDLADDSKRVLVKNFPDSDYKANFENKTAGRWWQFWH